MRILLVNNGVGTEFKNYNHRAADFKADADAYMAQRPLWATVSHL